MKLFAALFVTLLAVRANTHSPLNDSALRREVIVQVVNGVLNVTSNVLTSANSKLDDFKANNKELTDKLANFAAKKLQAVNSIIVSLINKLEDGATDQGKAMLACMDAEQEHVDAAILKTALIISDNAVSEYPLITDLLEDVLRQASELQDKVQRQTDILDNCEESNEQCLGVYAVAAVDIVDAASENIKENYNSLANVTDTIMNDVQSWNIGGIIRNDTQAIFNDLVVCMYA